MQEDSVEGGGERKGSGAEAGAVAEGFHFSAEGPGGAAAGPRAGTRDEGRWPEGGAEGPARGFEATRGGAGSAQSAEASANLTCQSFDMNVITLYCGHCFGNT